MNDKDEKFYRTRRLTQLYLTKIMKIVHIIEQNIFHFFNKRVSRI
jgi:hypothetical protein